MYENQFETLDLESPSNGTRWKHTVHRRLRLEFNAYGSQLSTTKIRSSSIDPVNSVWFPHVLSHSTIHQLYCTRPSQMCVCCVSYTRVSMCCWSSQSTENSYATYSLRSSLVRSLRDIYLLINWCEHHIKLWNECRGRDCMWFAHSFVGKRKNKRKLSATNAYSSFKRSIQRSSQS